MPYIGRSTDGFGVRNRFLYLASADDTSVSGADANGATLTFTDGAYVDVYLNGVLLKAGTDYNTNTANTIAGLSALAANDEVTVIVYDVFTVGDMVSATSGGTFVGNVTHNGTVTFGSTVSGLDVNGTEVILDADGDTTITADTDDQIDIKIAGADDFQFTANTFTAQSGSTIAAQALTATTITTSSTIDVNGNEIILDADADTSITADTDDRIDFKAANTDIVHILSTGMGIGTNNPAHTLDLKASAPELMLEETSSGGSKRLSLGVESDGTPFISAEQSGGQIEIQLSGNNEFQFLNGGRFRVTRTGVPAYISRGPVTGVTVDNGSTTTVAGMSGVLYNMVMVSTGGGFGAVYSMAYNSTVNLIHGTGNFSSSSGTSSSTNVYKSSGSHTVTLQNNTGSAVSYYILILSSYD